MPTTSRADHVRSRARRRSAHVVRARKLLYGGLLGGVVAAVASMVGFGLGMGLRGLASAALASAMVLFFYSAGQLVMVRFADAGARLLLAVAMASYTTRVVVIGLVLLVYARFGESLPINRFAVFISTIAVVVGWLVVEVIVFSRLRISVFDEPAEDARDAGDASDEAEQEVVR